MRRIFFFELLEKQSCIKYCSILSLWLTVTIFLPWMRSNGLHLNICIISNGKQLLSREWPRLYYMHANKLKNKIRTFLKSNRKIGERGKFDSISTQLPDRSLAWFNIDTSMKDDGVNLVSWDKTSPLQSLQFRLIALLGLHSIEPCRIKNVSCTVRRFVMFYGIRVFSINI